MLTVCCVNHGNYQGRGKDYVKNLKRMVERHLPIPHRFVCLTDDVVGMSGLADTIKLQSPYKGYWTKLHLFDPNVLSGDVLFFDLDVVITDSLLPLVALLYKSPGLWARQDFSYPITNPRQGLDGNFKKLLGGDGCVNSSVMLWHGDVAQDVWDKFEPWMLETHHGDQNSLSYILRNRIQFIPDELCCSYKYHVMRGAPVAPIVIFHGSPKVTQLHKLDPLRVAWEA